MILIVEKIQRLLLSRPGGREFIEMLNAARTYALEIAKNPCRQALAEKTIRSEM